MATVATLQNRVSRVSTEFASLDAAVEALGASNAVLTLAPGDTKTLTDDLTIPANVTIEARGGVVETGSHTLTINGAFIAGLHRAFDVSGGGNVIFGSGSVDAIYPQWFSTDRNGAAIQAALNSAGASGAPPVIVSEGTWVDCAVDIPAGCALIGKGRATHLVYPAGAPAGAVVRSFANDVFVDQLRADGNKAAQTFPGGADPFDYEAINFKGSLRPRVGEVWVENTAGDGVDLDGTTDAEVGTVHASNCNGAPVHPSFYNGAFATRTRIGTIYSENCGHANQRAALDVFSTGGDGCKDTVCEAIYSTGDYAAVREGTDVQNTQVGKVVARDCGPDDDGLYECVMLQGRDSYIGYLLITVVDTGSGGRIVRLRGAGSRIERAIVRDVPNRRPDQAVEMYVGRSTSIGHLTVTLVPGREDNPLVDTVGLQIDGDDCEVGYVEVSGARRMGVKISGSRNRVKAKPYHNGQATGLADTSRDRSGVTLETTAASNVVEVDAHDTQDAPTQTWAVAERFGMLAPNRIITGAVTGQIQNAVFRDHVDTVVTIGYGQGETT